MTETERMPKLVVGNTEPGCSKWKRGNGFLRPNSETPPKCAGMSGGFYSLLSRTKVIDTELPILVGRTIHLEVYGYGYGRYSDQN